MPVQWRKVRADLLLRPARTILTIASLAVGIFAVGAIYQGTADTQRSFEAAFAASNPPSAVMTIDPFDASLTLATADLDDVLEVEARRRLPSRILSASDEWENGELVSMLDFGENHVARIIPEHGAWPPAAGGIVLERASARVLGLGIGDRVLVSIPGRAPLDLEMTGTAVDGYEMPASFASGSRRAGEVRGYIAIETVEQLTGSRHLNALYLRATEAPLDRERAIAASTIVRDAVVEPAGLAVTHSEVREPGAHRAAFAVDAMVGTLRLLSIFIFALACALVVSTVSALLQEQRRQLGVMKAVGGTSGQIARIYLAYVCALELAALALAFPLSVLGGRVLASYFGEILNYDLVPLFFPWRTLLLQAGMAVGLPTLAVGWSVWRASRMTVRESITDYGLSDRTRSFSIPAPRLPRPARLALRNATRRRGRLALTLASLALTGALLVGVVSVQQSLGRLTDTVMGYWGYDIVLWHTEPVHLAEVRDVLALHAGVDEIEGWVLKDTYRIRADGTENENITLNGVPTDSSMVKPVVTAGRWLAPGDGFVAVVNRDLLNEEPDLAIGRQVVLNVEGHRRSWDIIGSVTSQLAGPVIYVSSPVLAELLGEGGQANPVAIRLADGASIGDVSLVIEEALLTAGFPRRAWRRARRSAIA